MKPRKLDQQTHRKSVWEHQLLWVEPFRKVWPMCELIRSLLIKLNCS